jgi:hypothetical protein
VIDKKIVLFYSLNRNFKTDGEEVKMKKILVVSTSNFSKVVKEFLSDGKEVIATSYADAIEIIQEEKNSVSVVILDLSEYGKIAEHLQICTFMDVFKMMNAKIDVIALVGDENEKRFAKRVKAKIIERPGIPELQKIFA